LAVVAAVLVGLLLETTVPVVEVEAVVGLLA